MSLKLLGRIPLLVLSIVASSLGCNNPPIAMNPSTVYPLQTPQFTNYYYYSVTECTYEFAAPPNHRVKVDCDILDMANSRNCQYAAFYIWPTADQQSFYYYCDRLDDGLYFTTGGRNFSAYFVNHLPNYLQENVHVRCLVRAVPDASPEPETTTPSPTTTTTAAQTTQPPNTCQCGLENTSGRIVGGYETGVNQYPYMAAIIWSDSSSVFCGGTLLSNTIVLTAAHCLSGFNAGQMKVVLGAHNIVNLDGSETVADIEELIIHEAYNETSVDNDIGLIKLKNPVNFRKEVSPVCLPYKTNMDALNLQPATIIGWGTESSSSSSTSDVLQEVQVKITTSANCEDMYPAYNGRITPNMFCAYDTSKDSCKGDSGGPLITKSNGINTIVGITSWGVGCAQESNPGVYTRLVNYLDWIQQKSQQQFCNP